MAYEYITGNNLENRQFYNYALFRGKEFLQDYRQVRMQILSQVPSGSGIGDRGSGIGDRGSGIGDCDFLFRLQSQEDIDTVSTEDIILSRELMQLWTYVFGHQDTERKKQVDKIVKTFEVRKRLYHLYNLQFKPKDENDYYDLSLYVTFACILVRFYERFADLKYLNALLKVNDILLSRFTEDPYFSDEEVKTLISYVIQSELRFVDRLLEQRVIGG